MIRVRLRQRSQKAESTVALINVVFLMLIFFLIAGTLAPTGDRAVDLVALTDADAASPPDMLFIRADGTLTWRGLPSGSCRSLSWLFLSQLRQTPLSFRSVALSSHQKRSISSR